MRDEPTRAPYALVVEDDLDSRMLVMLALQERIRAIGVGNGLEAIRVMMAALKHDNLPSIIFTDLNMPVFSGWELIELHDVAQPKIRDIPIVIMTGEPIASVASYRVLRKPLSADAFFVEVDRVLNSPSSQHHP